jgi:hypothetical protein
MSTLQLSVGDNGVSCWGWGPSRTVLHESKESSSVLGNNNALSDLEELSGIDTKEVEGLHNGNAPNHSAAQQPVQAMLQMFFKTTQGCKQLTGS